MVFYILRGIFILLAAAVALLYVLSVQGKAELEVSDVTLVVGIALLIAVGAVVLDIFTQRKRLAVLSGVFLGLIAGLIIAYAAGLMVDLVGVLVKPSVLDPASGTLENDEETYTLILKGIKLFIGLIASYWCISIVLQTRGDFRFVLPYIEFARQVRGPRTILLDTSVIIDGRILDIIETRIVQGSLVVPKFVLEELQLVADSGDKLKRARGRRGLEILQKLQETPHIEVVIHEVDAEGTNVDQKLVSLAQEMQARVMTNDFNLNKICKLRGVDVINLNDVAKSLRPVALPGEQMEVKIVKPGESANQGVGYLDDGTMIVVENGRRLIGEHVRLTVTSTLQTSAGRMIFGRLDDDEDDDHHGSSDRRD
jgi:uncharacterized protein YacL